MTGSNRREFLTAAGLGAVVPGMARFDRAVPPWSGRDLDELAVLFRKTPRADVLDAALDLVEKGADWRDLLGGAFLAGVHDVLPHPVGYQYHCVMMTASAYQIGHALPARDRILTALYNIDDFKVSQARDAQGTDWEMPAPKPFATEDRDAVIAELRAALDAWDEERADRAVTSLARVASMDEAFDVLWPYALRDFTNIGHKPICAAQAYRTLQHIGWRHGEPVLRSVVRGLLDGARGALADEWAPNLERSRTMRQPRDDRDGDPARSLALVAALRSIDVANAGETLAGAIDEGASVGEAVDGLRLFAAELVLRAPGILSVHAVTSLNAMLHVARVAEDALVRRAALLQAATFQVRYRDGLTSRGAGEARIDGLEPTDAEPDAARRAAFDPGSDTRARAAAMLGAGLAGRLKDLAHDARAAVVRRVREHHDYKFTAAVLEETGRAGAWAAPRILAACSPYLVPAGDSAAPFHQRVAKRLGR